MNDQTVPIDPASAADLRADMQAGSIVTADRLTRLAAAWQQLQGGNEDLSDLRARLWFWRYLPMIASQILRAELVERYAGYSLLLKRLAHLSLDDQDRLLTDEIVILVESRDGELVDRRVGLARLRAAELPLVLRGRVVSPADQRLALASQPSSPAPIPVDRRSRALARAEERKQPNNRRRPLPVVLSLTWSESSALQAHAEKVGLPVAEVVEGALKTCGLLTRHP